MGHRVGAVNQVHNKVNVGKGYWEGRGSSSSVECRSIDQRDLLRGLDTIRFEKVLGESPQIQVFIEAVQPPPNPLEIHSTP